RAEAAQRFLSAAGETLASSLDYDETLQRVARLAVPAIADLCVLYVVEQDGVRRLAVAHADPEKEKLLSRLTEVYRTGADNPRSIVGEVLRTGRPWLLSEVPPGLPQEVLGDQPELLRLAEHFEHRSAMVVPLEARRRILGVISLVTGPSGRTFDDEDL